MCVFRRASAACTRLFPGMDCPAESRIWEFRRACFMHRKERGKWIVRMVLPPAPVCRRKRVRREVKSFRFSSGYALFSMAGESSFRLSTKESVSQCGEGLYGRWFLHLHLVSYYPAWHIFADKPDNTFPHWKEYDKASQTCIPWFDYALSDCLILLRDFS